MLGLKLNHVNKRCPSLSKYWGLYQMDYIFRRYFQMHFLERKFRFSAEIFFLDPFGSKSALVQRMLSCRQCHKLLPEPMTTIFQGLQGPQWVNTICQKSGIFRSWASCQIRKIAGAHAPGTFSPSLQACDPDMHHGTCVTHVPWCMPGSLTSGFLWNRRRGETFPAFPAHAQSAILGIW